MATSDGIRTGMDGGRRAFLRRTALAAAAPAVAPLVIPSRVLGLDGAVAPSNRVTVGVVGTGDHGVGRNMNLFFQQPDARIVAVCDVDRARREKAKALVDQKHAEAGGAGCAAYNDFRDLLARPDIDTVCVATPDHWHVPISILALQAGKDVICEKPLSLTVAEGRALSDTARRFGRISQTASENRSYACYHRPCELVRNGRIGTVRRIEVGLPSGWSRAPASATFTEPPEGFDYDLWLGPAPWAPYAEARCHWNFRWIRDYSGGMLTDWGAHMIDLAQWALGTDGTGGPVSVEGRGETEPHPLYNTYTKFDLLYRYANGVELSVVSDHPRIKFIGDRGWIGVDGWAGSPVSEPASILRGEIGAAETHLFTCPGGEQRCFLDSFKSRRPTYAPFEVGHRTITIAHIGNIAMQLGRRLTWSPAKERFENDDTANRLLSRPMRAPWAT